MNSRIENWIANWVVAIPEIPGRSFVSNDQNPPIPVHFVRKGGGGGSRKFVTIIIKAQKNWSKIIYFNNLW